MATFHLYTILICLCAALGYINRRFIKLPGMIGLLIMSLGVSTVVTIASRIFGIHSALFFQRAILQVDFSQVVLEVMLCFLLFAGAYHADAQAIWKERKSIGILASFGTIFTTIVVAALLYGFASLGGLKLEWLHCLIFGALIAPTDPIAALSILNEAGLSARIKTNIAGESLFNDSIGIVFFTTFVDMLKPDAAGFTWGSITLLFLTEALGGILMGLFLGYIGHKLLKTIDDYEIEILITVALVMGGYGLSQFLHISGPMAMAVAGLITGGPSSRERSISRTTEVYMDKFWELIEMGFNSILFLLIGLWLIDIDLNWEYLLLGGMAVVVVQLSRFLVIKALSAIFRQTLRFSPKERRIISWSGLRGGLSLALVLSLPDFPAKDALTSITYVVVLFSIIVQGLTIKRLV